MTLAALLLSCAVADLPDWLSAAFEGQPDTPAASLAYGTVITGGPDMNLARDLKSLGTRWYLDYSFHTATIPRGSHKALKVRSNKLAPAEALRRAARSRPGSFWLIGNEPNVPDQDDIPPDEYARAYHYYASIIRDADPSARLVAPEVLNFDYTCIGCPGFPSGREFVEGFLGAYRTLYGSDPAIDVWSMHSYPLDWTNLPMIDASVLKRELAAFRGYVDSLPGQRGKPIWLTEFGIIWGYAGMEWREDSSGAPRAHPVGPFQEQAAAEYMKDILDWLGANRQRLGIERWFFFSSRGHTESWAAAPAGMALLERRQLTPYGELYRRYATRGP